MVIAMVEDPILEHEIETNLAREQGTRLFHGRGGCFEQWKEVNLDYYAPVLVVQAFAEVEEERLTILSAAATRRLEAHKRQLDCVLLQRRSRSHTDWRVLSGQPPRACFARENGLCYELELMTKQNIGFFPDMRLGRDLVRRLAKGKRVLNLFAYTCSFSVAALAGGARQVCNMDISKAALRVGRRNHIHNGFDPRDASFLSFDILRSFGRLAKNGPYDLVVIDPPTHQKGRFEARTDYARIVRRLPDFLAPDGHIIACLNAPGLGRDFLADLFGEYQLDSWLSRPPEFREKDEDSSLKIAHLRKVEG